MSQDGTDPARTSRFEALVDRVHQPVQRYARRRTDAATADDVVAETLTVLWRRLDDVPADAELAWAYGVARRCLANTRRGAGRRLRLVDRVTAEARVDAQVGAPPGIDDGDPQLADALARLGEDDREVLRLWAWEQLEAREIAAVLDISPNAASIRLHRAKRRLKDHLLEGRLRDERPPPAPDTDGDEDGKEAPE